MPSGFEKVSYHVVDKDLDELKAVGTQPPAHRGVGRPREADERSAHFHSDEAAARFYLSQVLETDERPAVRGLTSPDRAELVPDMQLTTRQEIPLTNTRLVHFEQTRQSIPVFGSHIIVELDQNRELLNVTGGIADIQGISPIPSLSPAQALQQIADLTESPEVTESVRPPELRFFHQEEDDTWHLAYFFRKVPAAPPDFLAAALERQSHGHGLGPSPRQFEPIFDYLIDAHDGDVLFYYSAVPMIGIPSRCQGSDEFGMVCEFWGRKANGGFEMHDPMRFIKTYDQQLGDLREPLPDLPIRQPANDWADSNRAAVSAHVNATRVYNFYKSVLMRDGIDDRGMELISVVNCTYSVHQPPPEWHNAVWYDNRMWYGQYQDENGALRSYSQFLDVIAHELTHGITDYTSDLVYRDQSGALNESFSDIFGIIISNWYKVGPDSDVSQWDWEIGPGLGPEGLPLRDVSDPTRTGDPDHMDNYLQTSSDNGGVHTNSNIHNKAAYNVLTAVDENGEWEFTPREVAVLYYLTLVRLSSLATFSEALESLVDVAKVYWAGDAQERESKIAAMKDAYQKVGITLE